ncbi:MAG: EamA/RhaT family transporter [Bacteroidetes bacterium]|nr:EamA/RhaT family transporter [Bacteroidota bacterium]
MKTLSKAHISQLVVTLIFAFNYSISKGMMPEPFQPLQIIFLRVLAGVIFFRLFHHFTSEEKLDRKDIWLMMLGGLFGFAMNQILFYEGLNLTTPVDAAILHVLNPIIVLLLAGLLIHEKVTWLKVSGIMLGAAGATLLIAYGKKVDMSMDTLAGNLLILGGTTGYAMYLVIIRRIMKKYSAVTVMKWVSLFGFAFVTPVSIHTLGDISWGAISPLMWMSLAYVIIINTFIAYLLLNFSLKHLTAGAVSFYIYIQVFIVAIVAIIMGTETLSLVKVIAAILIFAGVYLVNRKTNQELRQEES